ncbi:MAG TPA: hypothetical protein VHR66_22890 [Gemmataceae bacterium]|jgi:GTPase SAR1 family protein|nr:hypothetical protein [Gemmataceae bacterium]
MSALSPPPDPPVPDEPGALRIVLFGMPDAGKSSLLGALAQVSHTQGRELRGHLTDLTHGLGELRNRLYEERQTETQQEIVPYPVKFAPYGHAGFAAVVYDCDGRAANDFLTRKRDLEKEPQAGTLAGAIRAADVLLLTIDASAARDQIDADFREFVRFLGQLQSFRAQQHAVGGLPVFLVLTKCDLLARDRISRSMWEARIAERMKEVGLRFQQFLASSLTADHPFASFGSIALQVRATAVRRPELTDAAPQPREPYGVAELFQSAFTEAVAFLDRRHRAHKRLLWTVGGAGAMLFAMLIAGAIFLTTPSPQTSATLADRVASIRATEGPDAASRLGSGLDRRMREWHAVETDPGYTTLPDELQTFVQSRLDEGHTYARMRDELATIPPPSRAHSLTELTEIDRRFAAIQVPAAYLGEWANTDAIQQRDRMIKKEIPALREAVGKLTQFYFTLKNRAAKLLATTDLTAEWDQQIQALDAAEKALPFPRSDPVQGPAYDFDEVPLAQTDWQRTRDRLMHLRDLAMALGLLGDDASKAFLALTPPAVGANIPELASKRWQLFKVQYPDYAKWSLTAFSDAVRPDLERRLRRSVDQANRDGQRLILEKVKELNTGGKEEPADWPRVGEYLLSAPLGDWRELVAYLNRLFDPSAEDPVQLTAAFLRRTSFDIDPRRIRIRIPDTLSDAPVRPAGELALVYRKADSAEPVRLTLRPDGEPVREKQNLIYTFTGAGPAIAYRPGDTFYAELPVRKGDSNLKFTWGATRTTSFQFERLIREPRMHTPDQSNVDGILAEGVTTTVVDGKFPMVPAMVPLVRFDGK